MLKLQTKKKFSTELVDKHALFQTRFSYLKLLCSVRFLHRGVQTWGAFLYTPSLASCLVLAPPSEDVRGSCKEEMQGLRSRSCQMINPWFHSNGLKKKKILMTYCKDVSPVKLIDINVLTDIFHRLIDR